MTRIRFLLFVISFTILSILPHRLYAQDPPIVWGEIPRANLEMKTYPADTNASALILCDYGVSTVDQNYDIVFTRIMRIKILTTKGIEWGTHSVQLLTKKHYESINGIEGVTYSLDEHNEIVKTVLEKQDIYEEAVDADITRYSFTLPLLKPGCVVEFRYSIVAQNLWFIRNWYFQYSEPALWSEYRIHSLKTVGFMTVFNKNQPFAITEDVDEKCPEVTLSMTKAGTSELPCYRFRLAMKDIPALREEPFTTTMNDYRSKVNVQLTGWANLYSGVHMIMTDWKKLIDEMMDNTYFGDRIDDTRKVRKQTDAVVAGLTSPEEKLAAIYHWVATSVVCSGKNRLYADNEVNDVLESKTGTNAEITFLLLSMLKSGGIKADPVILSTRDNGKIQDTYPIESQFNYVLAQVTIGSQIFWLDATDPERPMGLLPAEVLNVKGLVVNSDSIKWVRLSTQQRAVESSISSLKVHEDGSISGTIDDSYAEYGGLFVRQSLQQKKNLEVAKEKFNPEASGITIDSVSVTGKDSIDQPIRLIASISSPSYALKNGDLIYLNPQITDRLAENPFKSKERKFPVDYGYPRVSTFVTNITIPDSFEVLERVSDKSISLAGNAAVYTRRVDVAGREIHLLSKVEIRKSEIPPGDYSSLREFYTRVVAAESEQFVLSRIKKVPVSAPADSLNQSMVPDHKAAKKAQKKGKLP